MKKVLICWVCCLTLAGNTLQAQVADSTTKETARDTSLTNRSLVETPLKETAPAKELTPAKEAVPEAAPAREWDNRWFISPLLKFQVQEFGMLEKNKMGFMSNANELPFMDKVNGSVAASAYKNLFGRLSFSVDIGMAYGHVTSKDKQISTTEKKTYNLLNAALYYHLLSHKYRLQPYVTVGINNLINDSNYTSVPAGIGLKFTSKKIMVMAQAAYGYSVSKTISNTLMYSMGVYIGINNKKRKKAEKDKADAEAAAKKEQEEKDKELAKKKDSAATASVVNNIIINLNVDSLINAKLNANGANGTNGRNGTGGGIDEYGLEDLNGNLNNKNGNGNGTNGKGTGKGNGNGNGGNGRVGRNGKGINGQGDENRQEDYADSIANGKAPHSFDLIDYQIDTINGKPVIRFMIYFYYKDYALTSRAFGTVDKVIAQLKRNPDKVVDIKGYTDNVGSTEYNNYLSMRRAQMTVDYMATRGVKTDRIIMSYFGKEYPVAENTAATSWLNRRVEIIIHDKD